MDELRFTRVGTGLYEIHRNNKTVGYAQKAVRATKAPGGVWVTVQGWHALTHHTEAATPSTPIWATRRDAGLALIGQPETAKLARVRVGA